MRTRTSAVWWMVLASAVLLTPSPAAAVYYYSTINVFSGPGGWVTGTSATEVDYWEYYDGVRPYVEGTLSREYTQLGWDYRYEPYYSTASVTVSANLSPGNAYFSMAAAHYVMPDEWSQYYVGSSQAGYYYSDPAAIPPYIYHLSPDVGVAGTSGYIPIYGTNLAPTGTTPQVSMDGATLWIVYQSDNQINVYYSYVTLGTHWLSVTTIYGTSNYVPFTALAGNQTPAISSIDPDEWDAGTTTDFFIAGTGFGTNPGLTIDPAWIEDYGIYSAWDTGINAWVRVSPYAPDLTVQVTVTSNGYYGTPFVPQYPNQPASGSANAQVNGAAAGCGDQQKDNLIAEYPAYGSSWTPACSDLRSPVGSAHFSASEINQDNDYGSNWTITSNEMLTNLELIRADAGNQPMTMNSGYRNPASQFRIDSGAHPNSRHIHGDAADIHETDSQRRQDLKYIYGPARGACVEPLNLTATWVHFDWRGQPCPQGY